MSVRSIKKRTDNPNSPFAVILSEFPKDKDGLIYVRQSSLTQQQKNIHSFEMQTDKFLEHFRDMGCTGNIEIVADDEALSGTLAIHARPGMTRMIKLIESGKIGWVGAVAVNRFTRDKWLITPGVLMKTCHDHDVWVATLRMHFNFKDSYCQRVFMLEAEEAARHLDWMKLVLGGGKETASSNGYYDGRFIIPGYIVDRTDPQRKRYVVYRPHAEIVSWLFTRFLELDGDLPQLCREVEQMPYVFPRFESWVDSKTVSRFSLHRKKSGNIAEDGNYKLSRHGLVSILTNPTYIGWWIPMYGGLIENNHEPIVGETLFLYAHKRLSTHALSGERQKPERVTRHSKVEALLKKVIIGPEDTPIYPSSANHTYNCREHKGRIRIEDKFAVSIEAVDAAFLEKFLERVQSIDSARFSDWEDKIERKRAERAGREELLRKDIREARRQRQETLDILDDPDIPKTKQMKIDYANKIAGLETRIEELQQELERPATEEDDEEILYEIHTLIPKIVALWDSLPFEKRKRFVGALIRRVVLSRPAPGWVKMEIHWKLPDWKADIGHIRRGWCGEHWSAEEEERLQSLYPSGDAGDILKAFPTRSWRALKAKGGELHMTRVRKGPNSLPVNNPNYLDMSYDDLSYAAQSGLALTTKNVQWSS